MVLPRRVVLHGADVPPQALWPCRYSGGGGSRTRVLERSPGTSTGLSAVSLVRRRAWRGGTPPGAYSRVWCLPPPAGVRGNESRFVTSLSDARNSASEDPWLLTQPVPSCRWRLCLCRVKEIDTPPAIPGTESPQSRPVHPLVFRAQENLRSSRSASRFWSRFLMVSRLSCSFLPLQMPSSHFTSPLLR